MQRRDFFYAIIFAFFVVAVESCTLWRKSLAPVWRWQNGQWQRVRMYQLQHGDRVRIGDGDDWRAPLQFTVEGQPHFSFAQWDWGIMAWDYNDPSVVVVSKPTE